MENLKKFLETPSPSGFEDGASALLGEMDWLGNGERDRAGNVYYKFGSGPLRVLITAHIDENGFQVQRIDDDGFIHFIRLGSTDKRCIPGSQVVVMTSTGPVPGVIGKEPVHTENPNKRKEAIDIKTLRVDVGATEIGDCPAKVGDPIGLANPFLRLGEHRISCHGLDDRIGVWIAAQALKGLQIPTGLTVYFCACSQEEEGCIGASIAAQRIKPDVAIDLDVYFASDAGGTDPNEYGDIKLGGGPAINYGPDCCRSLIRKVEGLAAEANIPIQPYASDTGGTNLLQIRKFGGDVETLQIGIPLRYMHTPVEVADLRDIEMCTQLLSKLIIACQH